MLDKFLEDSSNDRPNSREVTTGLVLRAFETLSQSTDPSPLSKVITTLHRGLTDSGLHSHLSSFKDKLAETEWTGCSGVMK